MCGGGVVWCVVCVCEERVGWCVVVGVCGVGV